MPSSRRDTMASKHPHEKSDGESSGLPKKRPKLTVDFSYVFLSGRFPTLVKILLSYLLPIDVLILGRVNKFAWHIVEDDERHRHVAEQRRHLLNPAEYSLDVDADATPIRFRYSAGFVLPPDPTTQVVLIGKSMDYFYTYGELDKKLHFYRKQSDGVCTPQLIAECNRYSISMPVAILREGSILIAPLDNHRYLSIKADSGQILSRYQPNSNENAIFYKDSLEQKPTDYMYVQKMVIPTFSYYYHFLAIDKWDFMANKSEEICRIKLRDNYTWNSTDWQVKDNFVVMILRQDLQNNTVKYKLQSYETTKKKVQVMFSTKVSALSSIRPVFCTFEIVGDYIAFAQSQHFRLYKLKDGTQVMDLIMGNSACPFGRRFIDSQLSYIFLKHKYMHSFNGRSFYFRTEVSGSTLGVKIAGIERVQSLEKLEVRNGMHFHPNGMEVNTLLNLIFVFDLWTNKPQAIHCVRHVEFGESVTQIGDVWYKTNIFDCKIIKLKWNKLK